MLPYTRCLIRVIKSKFKRCKVFDTSTYRHLLGVNLNRILISSIDRMSFYNDFLVGTQIECAQYEKKKVPKRSLVYYDPGFFHKSTKVGN